MKISPLPQLTRHLLTTISIGLTILALYALLSPGGDGSSFSFFERLFGGYEYADVIGHFLIHSALLFFWCWAIYSHTPHPARIMLAIGIIWSPIVEGLQTFVPFRFVSLLDLLANLLGTIAGVIAFLIVHQLIHRYQSTR